MLKKKKRLAMDCGQTLLCPFFCPSECCHLRAFALSPSVLGFPKETKPIGYIYIYIYIWKDLLKGLAQAPMEAKKSHSLLSASWRTKKAGAIIQSESKGLRTKGGNGEIPCLRSKA